MILTCPNCSTRYMIKDEAVGDNGRTVRCSKCSTSWFVATKPDALALDDHVQAEITEVETSDHDGEDSDLSEELRKSDEVMAELTSGAHVSIRDKADQERRRRRIFSVTMIWITTLALLALAAMLAYFFRQPIVEKFPQTSNIYQAFGVKVSATGLVLDAPQTAYITVEGEIHLVVNGTVQNLTKESKVIPLVKLSILNRNDEEITHWFVQPNPKNIAAKGRVEFAAEFPNPPVDAASLTYKLAVDEAE
ncbi:MAG: DUF3426 domain-containing protein [Maricaulaceae bacterium]